MGPEMIVVVVGMHRSGTSAVAGLLHLNQILMGEDRDFRPKPRPENPKGYYENYPLRRINDALLEAHGYRVKELDPLVPTIHPGFYLRWRMRRMIKRYDRKYRIWGWKDPRTCLTLDCWAQQLQAMGLLDHSKVVFVVRNPRSVARSMSKRKWTQRSEIELLELWRIYNEKALMDIDRFKIQTCYLAYERIQADPLGAMARLSRFLKHEFNDEITHEFISPNLDRSSKQIPSEGEEQVDARVREAQDKIQNRIDAQVNQSSIGTRQ